MEIPLPLAPPAKAPYYVAGPHQSSTEPGFSYSDLFLVPPHHTSWYRVLCILAMPPPPFPSKQLWSLKGRSPFWQSDGSSPPPPIWQKDQDQGQAQAKAWTGMVLLSVIRTEPLLPPPPPPWEKVPWGLALLTPYKIRWEDRTVRLLGTELQLKDHTHLLRRRPQAQFPAASSTLQKQGWEGPWRAAAAATCKRSY